MRVVVQFTDRDELKALPLLSRHSPGTALAERTYVIDADAARALREAGVRFAELSRDPQAADLGRALSDERI